MSDKYEEAAERIQASIDEWIAGPKDDRTFAGITATILREAFPAPSAQGEDERALAISRDGLLQLQLALNDAVNDIVGVFPPQTDIKKALIKAANDYINGVADYVAALRSRLAEPSAPELVRALERGKRAGFFGDAIDYPEPPECPYCGPDGTFHHGDGEQVCPYCGGSHEAKPEPAHAAPSGDRARRFVRDWLVTAKTRATSGQPWPDEYVDDVAQIAIAFCAALASERAKREGERSCVTCGWDTGDRCTCPRHCGPAEGGLSDHREWKPKASPAPDAAALREADYIEQLEEFAQSVVNWADAYPVKVFHEPTPEQFQEVCEALKVTPDCFAAMVLRQFTKPWGEKARATLLRSEPRGDEGRG